MSETVNKEQVNYDPFVTPYLDDKLYEVGLRPTRTLVKPYPPNEFVIDVTGEFRFQVARDPAEHDAEVLRLLEQLHAGIHRAFPDAVIKKNDVELGMTDDGALLWVATLDWDMSRPTLIEAENT